MQYSDGRVRVSTHLTHAADGQNLWSDSYERDLSDIFRIQSDIALEVAQALRVELSPAELQRVERVPTTIRKLATCISLLEAGIRFLAEVLVAMADVEQALVLDPYFIEAWAFLSHFRNYAQFIDPARGAEHRQESEYAARRALELDPEFGLATTSSVGRWRQKKIGRAPKQLFAEPPISMSRRAP